jgi:hypothetical protein
MDDIKIPKTTDTTDKFPLTEPTLQEIAKKQPEPLPVNNPITPKGTEMPKNKSSRKNPFKKLTKRQLLLIGAILLLVIGAVVYLYITNKDSNNETSSTQQNASEQKDPDAPPPAPTSPLTGRVVESAAIAARPVTGIMIENSPESRPQSGLYQADMVYEAIAEGGVTRFLSVYQESQPDRVGPVRSARPYYVDYIAGLDGSFGHVGGSPEALQDIKSLGVKDLDQFYNGSSYTRISGRYAPHNVYTDFTKIDALNTSKGYTKSTFTPFIRKIDVPQTPTAAVINFALSGPNYNALFTYDATSNSYLRSQAGAPHKDEITGKQINPKVVMALVTTKGYDPDGYHTEYTTTGSGKVFVFQDGIVSEGTWSKPDRKASLTLVDKYGLPMKLNAGQTWITLVDSADDVRYSTQ